MSNFNTVKEALEYIDSHLDEPLSFETIAERFHFSAYYFHRMFSLIVGKTLAAHVRDRRLLQACVQLSQGQRAIIDIALDCGFNSPQAFSRAFKGAFGLSPKDYRARGLAPDTATVDAMIKKFTNRLHGGVYVNPKIINREKLIIAGLTGDGSKTAELWSAFEDLCQQAPPAKRLSQNGYEIRLFKDNTSRVHVGHLVSDADVGAPYTVYQLPASKYASFDVYVADGYTSENNAMAQWLESNPGGYQEKVTDGTHYCVEYYDQRFNGDEAGSIVEIWVPIEKP